MGNKKITVTVFGCIILVIMAFFTFSKVSLSPPKTKPELTPNNSPSPEIPLSTLENDDNGYTVKYPTNFDAVYAQNGVDFTPKIGGGLIVLSVKNSVADVEVEASNSGQEQIQMLGNAAQIIKNSFQYNASSSAAVDSSNKGRFANVHFNPNKY